MFEYAEDGIVTELSIYVAIDAPVKFARLKVTNRSGRQRDLSLTGYWELVLGELRDKSIMHVVTELDPVCGAIFARNLYHPEFADRVVFVDASETTRTHTADRTEFLGRDRRQQQRGVGGSQLAGSLYHSSNRARGRLINGKVAV